MNKELMMTNPILYSNDMFEIRLDDIYICHDDTSGYVIMADMSKIFKMKLSKQINSDNVSYKYVKNIMQWSRRNLLLFIKS